MASSASMYRVDCDRDSEESSNDGMSSAEESVLDQELDGDYISDDLDDEGSPVCRAARGASRRGKGTCRNTPVAYGGYEDQDKGNILLEFNPSRPLGIHSNHPVFRHSHMTTALEFFHLFFTAEMINKICEHTNSYAIQNISNGSWKDVTPEEIDKLIALLIYFSLVRIQTCVEDYWSRNGPCGGFAKDIIPRERFFALMAFLHVFDPEAESCSDKSHKVQSFVEDFKSRCIDLYQPRQQVSIDERMFQVKSDVLQYPEKKPTKWGVKVWVLEDSSNKYIINFDIYIGRHAKEAVSSSGLGYDVVMKLMQPFFNQGYHLYIDDFFTSHLLLKDLFEQGVYATGITRETRKGFPKSMKNGEEWSEASHVKRGSMRWKRTPPILNLQWLDKEVFSVLSTIENANDHVPFKIGGKRRSRVIRQPQAIASCIQVKRAVNHSDEAFISTCHVLQKSRKWWKNLFFNLIDIAAINGYILFREHQAQFPDDKELQRHSGYSLDNFREEIIEEICDCPEREELP